MDYSLKVKKVKNGYIVSYYSEDGEGVRMKNELVFENKEDNDLEDSVAVLSLLLEYFSMYTATKYINIEVKEKKD